MWQLTGLTAPEIDGEAGAPIALLQVTGSHMAPIVRLQTHPIQPIPGVLPQGQPETITVIGVPVPGGPINVNAPIETVSVNAVLVGGKVLRLGEYSYNPSTQAITITAAVDPALPVTLQVTTQGNLYNTGYIDPSLFQVFWDLPIKGEISWSLSAENHPTASIALAATQDFIGEINDRFKVGTELNFAGIGWYVANYQLQQVSTDEAPAGLYMISVSLQGRWERKRYNRPSRLIGNVATGVSAPFGDADCQVNGNTSGASSGTVARSTTVQALAAQRGVPFVAVSPPIQPSVTALAQAIPGVILKGLNARSAGDVWSVEIPRDATAQSAVEWESEARSRLRMNGCFIDFSSQNGVAARDLNAVAAWDYRVKTLTWTNKGDCEFSGGVFGFGFEYAAATLSGKFSEPATQGGDANGAANTPPKWQRRKPKRVSLPSGDVEPATHPETVTLIKDMSLNWDASGPTKERVIVDLVDSQEVRRRRWVYGFAYTSAQAFGGGATSALPNGFWGVVQYEDTETLIDPKTNYLLGSRMTGWARRRFKQESDKLEILREYSAPQDAAYRRLYEFQQVPIVQTEKRLLRQFAAFYLDAANEVPPFETTKVCLPDGSSKIVTTADPNYVRPMFPISERSYKNSFISTTNPDSTRTEPLPDITNGEEQDSVKRIRILPSDRQARRFSSKGIEAIDEIELFQEFTSEFSAQGPQLREIATKKTFTTAEGRPGAAQRSPDLYEKVDPDIADQQPPTSADAAKTTPEYILCSPGHSPNQPSEGGVSAPFATSLSQALTHALTDYKIQDIQSSVDFSGAIEFNLAMRPFDKLRIRTGFAAYDLRVLSLNQKITVQGAIDGVPLLTGAVTQFTAGIDRTTPIAVTTRNKPTEAQSLPAPGTPPTAVAVFALEDLALGSLDVGASRSRGNY
jgi:hypothetical protein